MLGLWGFSSADAVLGTEELLARFRKGEIFVDGSWDPGNVRAAAYDLRVAQDLMIVPESDFTRGRRYQRNDFRLEDVILKPGDVAFVSTQEKFCVPWDITGNIGIKFTYARRGVLVLTGLLVDPGFGLKRENDRWRAKSDERLHFLLANVGQNEVVVRPGAEKIASVQFLRVGGQVARRYVESGADMDHEFFDQDVEPRAGLAFFKEMRTLQTDVKSRFAETERDLSSMKRSTDQVLVFGVILFLVTLLVALTVVLVGLLSNNTSVKAIHNAAKALPSTWAAALVAITVVAGMAIVTIKLVMAVRDVIVARARRSIPR